MHYITIPLNALMASCYDWTGSYLLAIVAFTLLTKIILLPLSLWLHRNGIKMVEMMPEINQLKIKHFGDKETIAEETQKLYKRKNYHPLASMIPMIIQLVLLMGVIEAVKALLGNDAGNVLLRIPSETGGVTFLMPLAAGAAAFLLTLAQNRIAPLQREQAKAEKLMTGAISVGISLCLGVFVSLGTGVYWIASNLFSILIQLVCNAIIKPGKYIDREALTQSKKELAEMTELGNKVSPENKKREKEDYKRFFLVSNKHLVFYSEKSGFYKYFKNIIEYLLKYSNVVIHYVTNDPQDQVFQIAETQPRIRPYCIGPKKIITLFMKMDADMVVMTTPDLENYYLKRSYVRKDIEYVYLVHGIMSSTMCTRKGAYDHFDTVLCAGQHQIDENRETERMYGLKEKNLIPCGYGQLDDLIQSYEEHRKNTKERRIKNILIAPSWQEGNILESCIEALVEQLYREDRCIVVRPHPEFIKRFPGKMDHLRGSLKKYDPDRVMLESDFSSNVTIFTTDLLVTDWSGIAPEFAFSTLKPVLHINTPMKVINPDYVKYTQKPLDITLREEIGLVLELDEVGRVGAAAEELLTHTDEYEQKLRDIRDQCVFNLKTSGEAGAKYLLSRLKRKQSEKGT